MVHHNRPDHVWTETQRTLLIPLAGRAFAHDTHPELGFSDPISQYVAGRLPFDLQGYVADRKSVWGTVHRTRLFDRLVAEFVAAHPDGHVLALGSGLCTRAWRLPNPPARWTEVEFPEVMDIKEALFPPAPDFVELVAGSATDLALVDSLVSSDVPTLILAEGVLMFIDEGAAQTLLRHLATWVAPGSELAFDYIHPWICRISKIHPSLKLTGASYKWGYRRGATELVAALPGAELVSDRLFSPAYDRFAALLERALIAVAGGPLYNVAHLRLGGDR